MDQASAAEAYRLNLVAGMGYRKALEFLAKDYAVYDLRLELDEAKEAGDQARMDKISAQIDEITGKWLSEIIQMIPDPLTKEAANGRRGLVTTRHTIRAFGQSTTLMISRGYSALSPTSSATRQRRRS